MKQYFFYVLLFFSTFLSCTSTEERKETEPADRNLSLYFCQKVRTLNFQQAGETPYPILFPMLYEGLTRLDEKGEVSLGLAHSYECSPDKKLYVFHLRKTVWSDQTPLTAHDFEYGWKKGVDPKTASVGVRFFRSIKNAVPCIEGKLPIDALGVKALDDYTLQIEFDVSMTYILNLCSIQYFAPVPRHLDQKKIDWTGGPGAQFISNGPFKVKSWNWDQGIVLEKNSAYWDASSVRLPGVDITFIDQEQLFVDKFLTGKIDWIGKPLSGLSAETVEHMGEKYKKSVQAIDSTSVLWFTVNTQHPILSNKKVRQAFSYTIPRELISRSFLTHATPAYGVLSSVFGLKQPSCFQEIGEQEARALLQEGLRELGLETLPPLRIKTPMSPGMVAIATFLQDHWSKILGIELKLEKQESASYIALLRAKEFDIAIVGWYSPACDPIWALELFKSSHDTLNSSGWENPRYQQLLELAVREIDEKKRGDFYIEAESLLMEESPIMPICFIQNCYLPSDNLAGYNYTLSGEVDFKFAHFVR